MKKMLFACFFFVLFGGRLFAEEVCLYIDSDGTSSEEWPNLIMPKGAAGKSKKIHHGEKYCFDMKYEYYMQYFLYQSGRSTVYGTKCRYVPRTDDEGKTVLIRGYNGNSICEVF